MPIPLCFLFSVVKIVTAFPLKVKRFDYLTFLQVYDFHILFTKKKILCWWATRQANGLKCTEKKGNATLILIKFIYFPFQPQTFSCQNFPCTAQICKICFKLVKVLFEWLETFSGVDQYGNYHNFQLQRKNKQFWCLLSSSITCSLLNTWSLRLIVKAHYQILIFPWNILTNSAKNKFNFYNIENTSLILISLAFFWTQLLLQ